MDKNNSAESRKSAADALGKIGGNLAIAALIKNLGDKSGPDYRTVGEACRASLAQIGEPALDS